MKRKKAIQTLIALSMTLMLLGSGVAVYAETDMGTGAGGTPITTDESGSEGEPSGDPVDPPMSSSESSEPESSFEESSSSIPEESSSSTMEESSQPESSSSTPESSTESSVSSQPLIEPEGDDEPVDPNDGTSYYTGNNTFQNDSNDDLVDDASVIEKLPVEELDSSAPETGEESEESEDLAKETAVKFGNNGGSGTLFWVGLSLILLGVLGVGTVIYLQVAPRLKARAAGAAAENDVMEDISSHERAEEPAQTPPADPSAEPPADPSSDTIDLESLMK